MLFAIRENHLIDVNARLLQHPANLIQVQRGQGFICDQHRLVTRAQRPKGSRLIE